MVPLVRKRWNYIYSSLLLLDEKLDKIGFVYYDGQVLVDKVKEAEYV